MNILYETARRRALARAVGQAILAPSVHNTQPWRFTVRADILELEADRSRQLKVLDPCGRELLISCGAALFNLRVSLTADGYTPSIDRLPDAARPDLLARVRISDQSEVAAADSAAQELARLDPYIVRRQTNRRRFSNNEVPPELIAALTRATHSSGAALVHVRQPEDRLAVGRLSRLADQRQVLNPAYRAELRHWTGTHPDRHEGVPSLAVPHVDTGSDTDLPIRDFDTAGTGYLPVDTGSNTDQCLLLLGTNTAGPLDWLRTGEALQHVLLEITRHGYVASPLTQIVEDPDARAELQILLEKKLRLAMTPHVLLRVGQALPTAGTPRRPVIDVFSELD